MELQCTFQIRRYTYRENDRNVSGYGCRVNKINYDPRLKTIKIVGNHQEGKTNNDVVGMSFTNMYLDTGIPFGLTTVFPNLMYLSFEKCGLKSLTKRDLASFDQLRGLWLPDNEIVSLENDVFENVQGLRYLCLYRNRLKFIGSEIFKPLKSLTDANFQQNTHIDKNYQNGNKEQFDALLEDIIRKCQRTPDEVDESKLEMIKMKKEINQLKEHVGKLGTKVQVLESLLQSYEDTFSRIEALNPVISDIQVRLSTIENKTENDQPKVIDLYAEMDANDLYEHDMISHDGLRRPC